MSVGVEREDVNDNLHLSKYKMKIYNLYVCVLAFTGWFLCIYNLCDLDYFMMHTQDEPIVWLLRIVISH